MSAKGGPVLTFLHLTRQGGATRSVSPCQLRHCPSAIFCSKTITKNRRVNTSFHTKLPWLFGD